MSHEPHDYDIFSMFIPCNESRYTCIAIDSIRCEQQTMPQIHNNERMPDTKRFIYQSIHVRSSNTQCSIK